MKKLQFILASCLFTLFSFSQEKEIIELAKKDLSELKEAFKVQKENFQKENSTLLELTKKLDPKQSDQYLKVVKIKKELDSIYNKRKIFSEYYFSKNVPDSIINKSFPEEDNFTFLDENGVNDENSETKVYYYFGKDKVINEQDGLFKDKKYNLIFNDILEAKSENYLGDFVIPQRGQKIISNNKSFYFKSIKIHIREGSLDEIQLLVTDEDNNELLFENQIPISLLRATRLFSSNSLFFRTATSNNKNTPIDIKKYKDEYHSIFISDVLVYIPNPGDNYIPEDLTLEFPSKTNGNDDNINSAIKYKINQNTSLQNIVELRTYTDFLSLFTENSANGIVQLEGKADFFVAPTLVSANWPFRFYLFKKISPFVNFSKIEKDVRNVGLTGVAGSQTIENSLDILQKSYLKMGLNLSVISLKIAKEFPFECNFYATAKYQISDLMKADSTIVDYKSFGAGGGLALEFKRFNNFGFIYSIDMTNYKANGFNNIVGIENPDKFWVLKNEAEVYYYPNKTKQQSIFLRLKTFNNTTKGNDEAFYQFQFGYRFSIGVSKLKQ